MIDCSSPEVEALSDFPIIQQDGRLLLRVRRKRKMPGSGSLTSKRSAASIGTANSDGTKRRKIDPLKIDDQFPVPTFDGEYSRFYVMGDGRHWVEGRENSIDMPSEKDYVYEINGEWVQAPNQSQHGAMHGPANYDFDVARCERGPYPKDTAVTAYLPWQKRNDPGFVRPEETRVFEGPIIVGGGEARMWPPMQFQKVEFVPNSQRNVRQKNEAVHDNMQWSNVWMPITKMHKHHTRTRDKDTTAEGGRLPCNGWTEKKVTELKKENVVLYNMAKKDPDDPDEIPEFKVFQYFAANPKENAIWCKELSSSGREESQGPDFALLKIERLVPFAASAVTRAAYETVLRERMKKDDEQRKKIRQASRWTGDLRAKLGFKSPTKHASSVLKQNQSLADLLTGKQDTTAEELEQIVEEAVTENKELEWVPQPEGVAMASNDDNTPSNVTAEQSRQRGAGNGRGTVKGRGRGRRQLHFPRFGSKKQSSESKQRQALEKKLESKLGKIDVEQRVNYLTDQVLDLETELAWKEREMKSLQMEATTFKARTCNHQVHDTAIEQQETTNKRIEETTDRLHSVITSFQTEMIKMVDMGKGFWEILQAAHIENGEVSLSVEVFKKLLASYSEATKKKVSISSNESGPAHAFNAVKQAFYPDQTDKHFMPPPTVSTVTIDDLPGEEPENSAPTGPAAEENALEKVSVVPETNQGTSDDIPAPAPVPEIPISGPVRPKGNLTKAVVRGNKYFTTHEMDAYYTSFLAKVQKNRLTPREMDGLKAMYWLDFDLESFCKRDNYRNLLIREHGQFTARISQVNGKVGDVKLIVSPQVSVPAAAPEPEPIEQSVEPIKQIIKTNRPPIVKRTSAQSVRTPAGRRLSKDTRQLERQPSTQSMAEVNALNAKIRAIPSNQFGKKTPGKKNQTERPKDKQLRTLTPPKLLAASTQVNRAKKVLAAATSPYVPPKSKATLPAKLQAEKDARKGPGVGKGGVKRKHSESPKDADNKKKKDKKTVRKPTKAQKVPKARSTRTAKAVGESRLPRQGSGIRGRKSQFDYSLATAHPAEIPASTYVEAKEEWLKNLGEDLLKSLLDKTNTVTKLEDSGVVSKCRFFVHQVLRHITDWDRSTEFERVIPEGKAPDTMGEMALSLRRLVHLLTNVRNKDGYKYSDIEAVCRTQPWYMVSVDMFFELSGSQFNTIKELKNGLYTVAITCRNNFTIEFKRFRDKGYRPRGRPKAASSKAEEDDDDEDEEQSEKVKKKPSKSPAAPVPSVPKPSRRRPPGISKTAEAILKKIPCVPKLLLDSKRDHSFEAALLSADQFPAALPALSTLKSNQQVLEAKLKKLKEQEKAEVRRAKLGSQEKTRKREAVGRKRRQVQSVPHEILEDIVVLEEDNDENDDNNSRLSSLSGDSLANDLIVQGEEEDEDNDGKFQDKVMLEQPFSDEDETGEKDEDDSEYGKESGEESDEEERSEHGERLDEEEEEPEFGDDEIEGVMNQEDEG